MRIHRSAVVRALLPAALLGGSMIPAALFAAQTDPPPASRRMKVYRSDTTRDTATMLRVTVNTDRIEQLIHDLMASRAMEQTIGQSLREAAGQAADPKKMRELSEELGRIAQKNASLITTIEMSCAGDRQPDGYIGVQFSELQTVMGEDAPAVMPLHDYPRIEMVYPGSPASKAGVHRGDVVLLIGGQDSRRAVSLDKLLKPAMKLPMRVQRDGANKDITIVVEKRPADFNSECSNLDQFISPEFDQPMIIMRSPSGPRAPGAPSIVLRNPTPTMAPDAPMPPMPPAMPPAMPPVAGYMYGYATTTNSAIAGATLMPLTDDWRATLGVDNGVLVTKVLPGTPAKDSGLRDGDVITAADGQSVASVRALTRIVGNSKTNSVKLQVIRAGKQQVVILKWQQDSP
jgi:S1-C subfamily serine protease